MTNDWAAFKAFVRSFLTDVVPGDNLYVMAVAEFVKAKFAREVEHDIELHNSYMQSYLVYRQRLIGYKYSVVGNLTNAVKGLITNDANRQGTGSLLDGMIAQGRDDIEGLSVLVEGLTRQGVIDIQSYIPIYRTGQETTFADTDFELEGKASKGKLPVGAQIIDASFVQTSTGNKTPLNLSDWRDRQELISGNAVLNDNTFYLCLDPWGIYFYVYPPVDVDHTVKLVWDGLKVDFADGDVVMPPFDEAMAQVVAEYVKGHIARDVLRDYAMSQMCLKPQVGTYYTKRRRLGLDAMDRQRTR
jgi:hypothetical protein